MHSQGKPISLGARRLQRCDKKGARATNVASDGRLVGVALLPDQRVGHDDPAPDELLRLLSRPDRDLLLAGGRVLVEVVELPPSAT